MNYAKHVSNKSTPQPEPIIGREQQMEKMASGGYAFRIDDWARLDRFLIIGSEGGTYYVKERPLTQENAAAVQRCLDADLTRTVNRVVEVSDGGLAPKNDPAVFVLAMVAAYKSNPTKAMKLVHDALPKVCRTGTHLLQFASAVNELRGWGGGLRRAVANWYTSKSADQLAYQVTKYQQRNGWSHKDVLRLCHASTLDTARNHVLRWVACQTDYGYRKVTRGQEDKAVTKGYHSFLSPPPRSIEAIETLKRVESAESCAAAIALYGSLAPRELVPTKFLTSPLVWERLLDTMPMTAMLRNLGNMTKCGLLAPLSDAAKLVQARLSDRDRLKKARVHPITVLKALKTYSSGAGFKGSGSWTTVQSVVDALNEAFYLCFDLIEPTGQNWLFGIDVSGSMSSPIPGGSLSSAEVAAALTMVGIRREPYTFVGGFKAHFEPLPISKTMRLDQVLRVTDCFNFGGTDASTPIQYALDNRIKADVFCLVTDGESWAGRIHPSQALQKYRHTTGINAKMVTLATTATSTSLSDQQDPGMLDVVGFSTQVPQLVTSFARGFASAEAPGEDDEDTDD